MALNHECDMPGQTNIIHNNCEPQQKIETNHILELWNSGCARALPQSPFQHFKVPKGPVVNDSMHVPVEQMLEGWPRTLIHIRNCNKRGWHGPKLVDYTRRASQRHINKPKWISNQNDKSLVPKYPHELDNF